MSHNFLETTLGETGLKVHRLGLSASYWSGKKTIYNAIDKGINYFFGYGFDNQISKNMAALFITLKSGLCKRDIRKYNEKE